MNEAKAETLGIYDTQMMSSAKMRNLEVCGGDVNQLTQDFRFKKLTNQQSAHMRITRNSGFQLERRFKSLPI